MADGVVSSTTQINQAQQARLMQLRLQKARNEAENTEKQTQDLKNDLRITEYKNSTARSTERVLMLQNMLEKGDGQLPVAANGVEKTYSSTTPDTPRYQPGELYHRTA
ncbi:hypothetical protein KIK84_14095 [Curvibacter sp. CHRR-16]|uniref:hypothetical protein n=1 Tax=Curvibacter sp. CHRR-16 TaxID=2835872 RepID=UPI001BDB23B8|nr:hypothetical protein [Curvibacter sp. CHRR-16]MBT0571456.1 hypothetical protein [Curvibacter sp. CHRR-16]